MRWLVAEVEGEAAPVDREPQEELLPEVMERHAAPVRQVELVVLPGTEGLVVPRGPVLTRVFQGTTGQAGDQEQPPQRAAKMVAVDRATVAAGQAVTTRQIRTTTEAVEEQAAHMLTPVSSVV